MRIWKNLTHAERIDWIRLIRTTRIGPHTFWELIKAFASPSYVLDRLPEISRLGGRSTPLLTPSSAEIKRELDRCTKFGATVILACDKEYSQALLNIPDAPPVLTVKGNVALLNKEQLAIVGSRSASINGITITAKLATELGQNGYIITSGLAKGIDIAAHKSAIETGTVAVIAGGIDHVYPKENASWFQIIAERGLLVSELPIGSIPLTKNFPQRNRIIAGLSTAVIVIEAAHQSGTLITARHALEYGRDVMAVPGSPLDARSQGTNALIKQGAALITNTEDVLEVLKGNNFNTTISDKISSYLQPKPLLNLDDPEIQECRKSLLNYLSYTPSEPSDIADYTSMPVHILSYLIVELELAEKIIRSADGKIALKPQ